MSVTAAVAVFALILSLASSVLCLALYRATATARSATPGEVLVRMAELEQEWASQLDSNARFMKRLAKRQQDEAKRASESSETHDLNGGDPKSQLRAIARQKGILR